MSIVYQNPIEQVRESVQDIVDTLQALFTPHSTVSASQLSGPIGIMNIFFVVLSSENGWRLALWLAVVINVNLALINLFPFPILDGAHPAFGYRMAAAASAEHEYPFGSLQTARALVLISYGIYITFFDVQDSGKMALNLGSGEIKFAPKPGP